jgi:hypothetical protein
MLVLLAQLGGCSQTVDPDGRELSTGYRDGTRDDGYLSSGERGQAVITEIHWAGSVRGTGADAVYDPGDVFVEIQNRHARPIHLTGWQIEVERGVDDLHGDRWSDEASSTTYVLGERRNGLPIESGEFVVIAARADGAFADADYVIDDLEIGSDFTVLTLRDADDRLIEPAGSSIRPVFGGAWDYVTARSMERTQLLFGAQGGSDWTWHSYSLNEWDGESHEVLRERIAEAFRPHTYATPGMPNSPDYSGNTSSGSLE